ncbi:MAG: MBL fold metallo-hydrolase [Candidatus Nanosalina sp.]
MKVDNLAESSEDFTGNVWLIEGKETLLVDVGTGDCWKRIRELKSIDKVIVTHSHHDHVENLSKVVENFNPEVYAFEPGNLPVEAEEIDDRETLEFPGLRFQVFHTPGHKDDSICLYNPSENILFSGDLIFPEGGFGRTDLEEGDRDKLIESIERIEELEVESFYPGHGEAVIDEGSEWISKSLENAKKREPKY